MILQGDAQHIPLDDQSAQCIVMSPPYWGLRDYGLARWEGGDPSCDHKIGSRFDQPLSEKQRSNTGSAGQYQTDVCRACGAIRHDSGIGLKPRLDEYIGHMRTVGRELWRVLRDDGTLWMNIGDCYGSGTRTSRDYSKTTKHGNWNNPAINQRNPSPAKQLLGLPWRVAFAFQEPWEEPGCVTRPVDRAWLAAMFDGEGTIGIRRFDSYREEKQQVYQDGFVVYTTVTNNDVPLLDRCVELTGFGKVALKQAAESTDGRGIVSRRDSYGWRLDGNKAVDVIRAIYPFLIAKKKQACIAYTLDGLNKNGHGSRSVPKDVQGKKELLWDLIKMCNQREEIDLPDWIEEPRAATHPGWYLRSDIIWAKANPMPESVTDRPTRAHEYLFLMTKQARYHYDAEAIAEPAGPFHAGGANNRLDVPRVPNPRKKQDALGKSTYTGFNDRWRENSTSTRNRRTVWTIPTQPYKGAHFATFPEKLVEPCILAGTSPKCCGVCGAPWARIVERGDLLSTNGTADDYRPMKSTDDPAIKGRSEGWTPNHMRPTSTVGWHATCEHDDDRGRCLVLDPFCGSGTVGKVALEHGRRFVGIDLSVAYLRLARDRMRTTVGMSL